MHDRKVAGQSCGDNCGCDTDYGDILGCALNTYPAYSIYGLNYLVYLDEIAVNCWNCSMLTESLVSHIMKCFGKSI